MSQVSKCLRTLDHDHDQQPARGLGKAGRGQPCLWIPVGFHHEISASLLSVVTLQVVRWPGRRHIGVWRTWLMETWAKRLPNVLIRPPSAWRAWLPRVSKYLVGQAKPTDITNVLKDMLCFTLFQISRGSQMHLWLSNPKWSTCFSSYGSAFLRLFFLF